MIRIRNGVVASILFLTILSSCYEEKVETIPHYALTNNEKSLFPHKKGDSLVFENMTGDKIRYVVEEIKEERREHHCCLLGKGRAPEYTYDEIEMIIMRTSPLSVYNYSSLKMYKAKEGPVFSSSWHSYIGSSIMIKTLPNVVLYDPETAGKQIENLTVRGINYKEVQVYETNRTNFNPLYQEINKMYYSMPSGYIKLEGINGEVWERIK